MPAPAPAGAVTGWSAVFMLVVCYYYLLNENEALASTYLPPLSREERARVLVSQ